METQTQQPVIPTLANQPAVDFTLAMFKADEQFSFVRPYSSSVTSVTGYRHAVIRYRVVEKKGEAAGAGKVEKPAKMVTVPSIVLPELQEIEVPDKDGAEPTYQFIGYQLPDAAKGILLGVLEDQQDALIRGLIDEGKDIINWSDVSLDAVISALTATRISSRLTKEGIENWFNAAGNVVRVFCEKRGAEIAKEKGFAPDSEDSKKQIAGSVKAYRENFAKLAAAVPNMGQNAAIACQNVLKVSEASDDVSLALGKKLYAMLNPVVLGNSSDL